MDFRRVSERQEPNGSRFNYTKAHCNFVSGTNYDEEQLKSNYYFNLRNIDGCMKVH
jgi:hypothetical protein